MKSFRLVAAAGVVALVLLAVPGAGPALAAGPDILINTPGSDATVTSAVTIAGSISQGGTNPKVDSASVALTSPDPGASNSPVTKSYNGSSGDGFSGGGANVSFSFVVTPKYNGRYTITVNSTGEYTTGPFDTKQTAQTSASRSFNVEIKPVKPVGVSAGLDESTAQATVTWSANPEPDMLFYQVLRSYQNGAAGKAGTVAASSKPTFHDDLTGKPAGSYKYQVQAVRRARTCADASTDDACSRGVASDLSAFSAAVTVRGTPVTTTTTTSTTIKRSSGSGSGSGSTSGSGSGSGSESGSGTTTGGTTSSGGKKAPSNSGGFAPGGNVDLSQFAALLGGNGKTTGSGKARPEDEGTYDATLGYNASEKPVDGGGGDSLISIGGTDIPRPSDDWVRFVGAGSLMTALLVHVLWFKQQVDRVPLETIYD